MMEFTKTSKVSGKGKAKKILLLGTCAILALSLSGCGKDDSSKTSSNKEKSNHKVTASSKKSDEKLEQKDPNTGIVTASSETQTNGDDQSAKDNTSNSDQSTSNEVKSSSKTNSTGGTNSLTASSVRGNTTGGTGGNTAVSQPKPQAPSNPAPSKPAPSNPTPPSQPAQPAKPVIEQVSLGMLDPFMNRSSSYVSVKTSQLDKQFGNYSSTSITGTILAILASGRASVDEIRNTVVGKSDGSYKITGVYTYSTVIPDDQDSYSQAELATGNYYYDRANQNGLFNSSFSGVRYDACRAVVVANHFGEGMKVTRVVITFEKM